MEEQRQASCSVRKTLQGVRQGGRSAALLQPVSEARNQIADIALEEDPFEAPAPAVEDFGE
jgi:hypothetical protein